MKRERQGKYLGKTVQVIPHITDQIKLHIREGSKKADIAIIEVGGTVGDIESLPFLEAIRQMGFEGGRESACYIHLTLLPWIAAAGELKTKPTQHSVKELREICIQPDILICRSERSLPEEERQKIALFTNVKWCHTDPDNTTNRTNDAIPLYQEYSHSLLPRLPRCWQA